MTTDQAITPRPGMTYGQDGRWQAARRDPAERAERDDRIRALRDQSMSMMAIAAEVGTSYATVHRVLYGRRPAAST